MRRRLAADRIASIRRLLEQEGSVSVAALAESLEVSRETIRRDLKQLAERGDAEIVHGGATTRRLIEPTLTVRSFEATAAKVKIARTAAGLVSDGATVLIDSGSTTLALARELTHRGRLTVATNSLGVATLLTRAGHTVHVLGGEVDSNDEAMLSADAVAALDRYRFDIAFVGSGGLSAECGLTDYTRTAAAFRARLIVAAARSYLLADSTKFDVETPFPVANAGRLAGVIADARPKGPLLRWFSERRIRIMKAG